MSCNISDSVITPIISKGLALQELINNRETNGWLYANQINNELHSIIDMLCTPSNIEFQERTLQGRIQIVKDMIKASSHPSSSDILQHVEKIHKKAEAFLKSNEDMSSKTVDLISEETLVKQYLIRLAQDDANKLVEKLWAMISTLSQRNTHEENFKKFNICKDELLIKLGHQGNTSDSWKPSEQVHILHNLAKTVIQDHEKNGCSQKKRKMTPELEKCGDDSKHSKEKPKLTVQLPGYSSSSSSLQVIPTFPITPPSTLVQLASFDLSRFHILSPVHRGHSFARPMFKSASDGALHGLESPSTPIQQTSQLLSRLQVVSPKTSAPPTPSPLTPTEISVSTGLQRSSSAPPAAQLYAVKALVLQRQ